MRIFTLARFGGFVLGALVLLPRAPGAAGSDPHLPEIAVFSGPNATILNTDPPVTSQKARTKYGLPPLHDWFGKPVARDTLYYQRLAAPVTVYIDAFSAHPLEADAAQSFAPPDGYLDASNTFRTERRAITDRPVYQVVLDPADGLYPLPYMARRSDGSAWEDFNGAEGGVRQTFFPDASRLFEEIERAGSVLNGNLSGRARFTFLRAAPSGGYVHGQRKTDSAGLLKGDAMETAGVDFFPYAYSNTVPPRAMLAQITNSIAASLKGSRLRGVLWLEGSPRVEDTLYWLSLLIDTDAVIVGTVAQRPNHRLSADAPQNVVDAVDFVLSDVWRDADRHNRVGAVLVQDQQIFSAREVTKVAPRPGGFSTAGGHGGIIGSTMGPTLTFLPNRRHGARSEVRLSALPHAVPGLRRSAAESGTAPTVVVKDAAGDLRADAIPHVEILDFNDWMSANPEPTPVNVQAIEAFVKRSVREAPLAGAVAESVQGGHFSASESEALDRVALRGIPVVKVFRGATGSFVYPNPGNLLIEGSNLGAAKARVLLMACLLKWGALPGARDPAHPTEAELSATRDVIARYQEIFNTH